MYDHLFTQVTLQHALGLFFNCKTCAGIVDLQDAKPQIIIIHIQNNVSLDFMSEV